MLCHYRYKRQIQTFLLHRISHGGRRLAGKLNDIVSGLIERTKSGSSLSESTVFHFPSGKHVVTACAFTLTH